MNDQLPGFDDIPESPPKPKRDASSVRYYLEIELSNGQRYFLHKTHMNGGREWQSVDNLKRWSPLRYKTYSGAKRMLWSYTHGWPDVKECRVVEWKGKQP